MSELDLYYRAFRAYSALTKNHERTRRLAEAVKKAGTREDTLEAIRTRCIIEEDWILAIEKYLPYVDNAIREDRQFIRKEGEVVLIEKAKKVSKDSVVHLARHSDMITRLPEDEEDTLVPDRIFMTENESNFAVYENRFLYMLLCYLRDFVELRYAKISELGNTYAANFVMKRRVHVNKRDLSYDMIFHETAKNDPRSRFDKESTSMIERVETIRVWVTSLLMTPLMNEVAKAPMLKPPITRTNVLKMDNNFKNAVELYDYLAAYTADGYRIEQIKKVISPFHDALADNMAEMVPLTSFFAYQYGNDLEEELLEAFKKEEAVRRAEESEKERRLLDDMKRRIEESGESPEAYLVRMEQRNHRLELEARKVAEKNRKLTEAVEEYQKTQEALTARVATLEQESAEQKAEIVRMTEEHAAEIAGLIEHHETEIRELTEAHETEIRELTEAHRTEVREMTEAHRTEVRELTERHETAVRTMLENHRQQIDTLTAEAAERQRVMQEDYTAKISAQTEEYEAERGRLSGENGELNTRCRELETANLALLSRVHAWQHKMGEKPVEDETSEAYFKQLEKERKWFDSMFDKTWKDTKKRIRKDLLWTKPEKPEKKGKGTKRSDGE